MTDTNELDVISPAPDKSLSQTTISAGQMLGIDFLDFSHVLSGRDLIK